MKQLDKGEPFNVFQENLKTYFLIKIYNTHDVIIVMTNKKINFLIFERLTHPQKLARIKKLTVQVKL